MKKLELREGKGFLQDSTANYLLQCVYIYELPPSSRALWRHLGTNHRNAGLVSSPPVSRAEEHSGKLSFSGERPVCLSHWHLEGLDGARWAEHVVPKISACSQRKRFPPGERAPCAHSRDDIQGRGRRQALARGGGAASIRGDLFGWSISLAGAFNPFLQIFFPLGVCVSLRLSHLKMLQKANSVALATPASASFDGAALQGMESGPGHIQHKGVTFLCYINMGLRS